MIQEKFYTAKNGYLFLLLWFAIVAGTVLSMVVLELPLLMAAGIVIAVFMLP